MFSNKIKPTKTTITTTQIEQASEEIVEKKKKIVYLILKKKNFGETIVEEILEETNRRFKEYMKSKIGKLIKSNPQDPENFIKYILVSAYIKVLTKLSEEYHFQLSEKDKELVNEILNPENEKKEDIKEKKIENDKKEDINKKNNI